MIDSDKVYDVVIVGGGPAGMAASMWCAELGLDWIMLEKDGELGGQLHQIYNPILNYPGLTASGGNELYNCFLEQLRIPQNRMATDRSVAGVTTDPLGVELTRGPRIEARSVVIATGVRRRKLMIAGEEKFTGRGILDSGSRAGSSVAGRRVAIIGGGDAALENAVILGKYADRVFVIHRRDEFSARPAFIDAARSMSNVEFHIDSIVTGIEGGDNVEALSLRQSVTGEATSLQVENVLIRIGVEPNSDLVKNVVELDSRGYIRINSDCETGITGLYAIGDVANPNAPTISSSVGHAATAVKCIFSWLNSR